MSRIVIRRAARHSIARFVVLLSASITVLVMSGCAQFKPTIASALPPAVELDPARTAALLGIEQWSFRGRAAVQRGDEGWSATLHWQQSGNDYRLRIVAPLGRGTFEILSKQGAVQLIDANNQVYRSNDAETLLRESTGWELPINDIEFWVRGVLRPGETPSRLRLGEDGLLQDFASAGWRVSYLEYQNVEDFELPRKMYLSHGDTKIRLVVASWALAQAGTKK